MKFLESAQVINVLFCPAQKRTQEEYFETVYSTTKAKTSYECGRSMPCMQSRPKSKDQECELKFNQPFD